jgi:hypothetical protein
MAELIGLPSSGQRNLRRAGWVLLLLPFVIVGYELARLTPVYLNYVKVARSLDAVAAEYHDGDDPESLTRSIAKHFQSESVLYPQAKDIRISRDGTQWVVQASYDDQAPLIGNVAVLVSFEKTVRAPVGAHN